MLCNYFLTGLVKAEEIRTFCLGSPVYFVSQPLYPFYAYGKLLVHVYQVYTRCTFSAHWQAVLFRPQALSRALGFEARRRAACTLRCKLGPRTGFVAHAMGVRSCASWLTFTGLLSSTPSRPGTWKPHNSSNSLCCCCIAPSLQLSSPLLCGSHGTTAVAYQTLLFVTTTDGASVCACVCHDCCGRRK